MKAVRISTRITLTALLILMVSVSIYGQEERGYIRKGNRLYEKGEFAGGEGMYRRAQGDAGPSTDALFNLGDALYKQGRFGEAATEFSKAVAGDEADSLKQAEGLYNLGNSLLKEQKFEESIGAYINSLKLNPGNMQAKYNLAWAQDQLKKQQQQDQQQNQDQQKDQNKDNENKEDQQQDKNNQQQDQENKDQQQQQQQQPSISREDAKRLLDALAANEKETQEKVQRDKAARAKVRVIKNW